MNFLNFLIRRQQSRLFHSSKSLLLVASASFLASEYQDKKLEIIQHPPQPLNNNNNSITKSFRVQTTVDRQKSAFSELSSIFKDRFSTDLSDREDRGLELSGYAPRANPDAIVWPCDTDEVSQTLAICNRYQIPVIALGGGTSVEGHISAIYGGVCIDMSQMDKILDIHEGDEDVVVQAGIGWMQLNEELSSHGYFVSADPGPGACVGGMCATGCSGTNAVRYGTMKDQVLSLVAVLADGTVIRTRQRPRKSSAGYDLTRLLIGSEGTLGIITEVTMKMRPIPPIEELAYVQFPSVHEATSAVIDILRHGIQMGAIEICDETMIMAMNAYSKIDLPETHPILLLKFTSRSKIHCQEDIQDVANICENYGGTRFIWCSDTTQKGNLWNARKQAFWAAQAQHPQKRLMATDVAVPISHLADLISLTQKEIEKSKIYGPIVGHVGDGNFHVCLMIDPNNADEVEEARRLNQFMVMKAIAMEGTCTGEHGIGVGKKVYLENEIGTGAINVMRKIKRILDPNWILNPGKIFDP